MGKIGVSIYALHVYDGSAQAVELHSIIQGKSIIELTKEFIQYHINTYVNDTEKESIFKFVDWEIKQAQVDGNELLTTIYGRIKTGEYGVESEIVDIDTGVITHRQTSNEAKVLPFDFCISLGSGIGENGNTVALAILQTNGIYGIKTIFEQKFREHIQSYSQSLVLNFGMIYPKAYLNNFLNNGELKKIELFKYDIPNDIADRVGVNNGSKRTKIIFSILNPVGFLGQKGYRIRECLDGQRVYSTIVEMPDFEYDDIKLEFRLGNTTKKFSMKNLDKVVITADITDQLMLDGGNPTKNSIIPILLEFSKDYLYEMGLIEQAENEIAIATIDGYRTIE